MKMSKKWLAGTVAAALLIGGGALVQTTQAHADPANGGTSAGTQADPRGHGNGQWGRGEPHGRFVAGDALQETAALLGMNVTNLKGALPQEETLLKYVQDKTGWSEEDYLAKLTDAEKRQLAQAVTDGKLTQTQADQISANLPDPLKQAIERTPAVRPDGPGHGGKGFGGPGMMGDPAALANLLGISQDDLKAQLDSGTSLVDIAKAKGISEDQLITAIKDGMTDRIKPFAENVHVRPDRAGDAASQASHATSSSGT